MSFILALSTPRIEIIVLGGIPVVAVLPLVLDSIRLLIVFPFDPDNNPASAVLPSVLGYTLLLSVLGYTPVSAVVPFGLDNILPYNIHPYNIHLLIALLTGLHTFGFDMRFPSSRAALYNPCS